MISFFCRYKSLLIFSGLFLSSLGLFSQRMIEIKYEADAKGGYVFSCFNYGWCHYILDLGFTSFQNVKSDQPLPFHGEVKPGYNRLFNLTPLDAAAPVRFSYNSRYQKGCMHPVVNRGFTYLLPISPGKQAQFYEMSPDKLPDTAFRPPAKAPPDKNADSASWYVVRLKMKPGDTIYAARKGIVNELQDQNGANDAGQTSIGTENFIEIVQSDCSFARYGILKKNSALVKPGQTVKAGQPIGLVGGDSYGRGSDLRFSVYYYQEENTAAETGSRHYIITHIWTKNNGSGRLRQGVFYISEFPKAVLNQETPPPASKKQGKSKKPAH